MIKPPRNWLKVFFNAVGLDDIVLASGFMLVSIGAGMAWLPAGFMVAGAILLALALDLFPRSRKG